ncbi:sensor histidine kinase [Pacificimonas flava]|uniref:sensor histidine kinase n=1 Tax=Pacificimonas flava TaxID=1234595 RepID=UPI00160D4F28|nr:cache domain-containing protein [Pacificimonas flava]MBB5280487.1 two-component system C4-dicarboxylate transport sensor histidine kinase DctB [Pacificimonas flava]
MAERRHARPLLLRTALGGILLAAIVGAFVLVDGLARRAARAEAAAALENAVDIFASGLQSELDKFRLVPLVLAEDPEARRLLRDPAHPAQDMNRRLEALARRTDASAIYLMNAGGDTVAASNWQQADSFVGANYAFRRYFHDALIRGDAAQFALGTRSRHPGLYIARRVGAAENALGVVVVKVEFDALERLWRQAAEPVFVADRRGVVLITSRPDWRFHTITPETGGRAARARNLTQFGRERLPLLDAYAEDTAPARATIDAERPVSLGWTLHMLADADDALRAASGRARLLLAAGLLATAALAGLFHQIRRARLARAEAATRARIDELREQLVQANRLAVLGQIAASVGHEINQPVAAAQVYAESGAKLLGAGRLDDARRNFGHIADLTLRIGEITGELRRFARKGRRELRQVRVGDAIESALRLLARRIHRTGPKGLAGVA